MCVLAVMLFVVCGFCVCFGLEVVLWFFGRVFLGFNGSEFFVVRWLLWSLLVLLACFHFEVVGNASFRDFHSVCLIF